MQSKSKLTYTSLDNIYLLKLPGADARGLTLKRVKSRNNTVILLSDNGNYEPYIIELEYDEGFEIMGKVIWMWREY